MVIDGDRIFAGSPTGVYLSIDHASSWTAINTGLTNKDVYSIAISGNILFAGTQGGVYRSTNGGTNWTPVNSGLTNLSIRALYVVNSTIFAGTFGGGVFMSSNNGTNWVEVNSGLPVKYITSLGSYNNYLLAGTYYQGIWKCPLILLLDIKNAETSEDWVNILPNPATSEITLEVSGSPVQVCEIVILDLNGIAVKQIKKSGNRFQISISDLPQGIYILKMFQGNHFHIKKFIKI